MGFGKSPGGLVRWWIMGASLAAGGCVKDTRLPWERGSAGIFENVPEMRAPQKDRCLGHGAAVKAQCQEAKYLAQLYARRLAVGDAVCLEGGFGEEPGAACSTRAAVVNTAPDRVLIEVRAVRPESRWFTREQHQVWFDEGALVDLYLFEHGY